MPPCTHRWVGCGGVCRFLTRLSGVNSWNEVSDAYAQSFGHLCAGTHDKILQVMQNAADEAGNAMQQACRILDVGSGDGRFTQKAVSQGWNVTACDTDPDMVALTNAKAPGRCTVDSLPELTFPDEDFSGVVANFVINHMGDPRAAVRELQRVGKPGATYVFTIWPTGGAGWQGLVAQAFSRAGATELKGHMLPPHLDFERSATGLAAITKEAGLNVISADNWSWDWVVEPAQLWAGIAGGVAGPGARYRAQTPETRSAVEEAFTQLAAEQLHEGKLIFPCTAAVVIATK